MATYAELQLQIEKLQAEAEKARKDEMNAAIAQVKALMAQHGITLEDMGCGAKKARKGLPLKAKYRDTATGNEWSGRGQPPKWIKDHLAQGKNKEDFLVQS